MKSLKKLAGMIGLVILLCGIMTGCSGKRLYSEEELTQIHDVVGAVEQITKEFQYVIGGSMQSLLEDSSSRADLMDYVSTRKYDPDKKIIALTFDDGRAQRIRMAPVIFWMYWNSMTAVQHFFVSATILMTNQVRC